MALTAGLGRAEIAPPVPYEDGLYLYPSFDPKRDPDADLAAAKTIATETGKFILLEAGGDWCVWCSILDRYIAKNDDVRAAFSKCFVWTKVHVQPGAELNRAFLAQFADVPAYPFFLILDKSGRLVATQRTGQLESGGSYDRGRMMAFAQRWEGSMVSGAPVDDSVAEIGNSR